MKTIQKHYPALLLIPLILFTFPLLSLAESEAPYNAIILEIVHNMPKGGGYDASDETIEVLKKAIHLEADQLIIDPRLASPSFCTGATYLVLLELIAKLQKEGVLHLNTETLFELLVQSKPIHPDGTGVWGRWNSDGPGTGRLFKELELGPNFTEKELAQAIPGDFLKIFWNEKIGKGERGHSVVFLGEKQVNGENQICYWSSGTSDKTNPGMEYACVKRSAVKRAVFSRIKHLENLRFIPEKMGRKSATYADPYLSSLKDRSSTPEEMYRMIGYKKL